MAKFVNPTVQTITQFGCKQFTTKCYFFETQKIELAGRTCYDSYDKIKAGSDVSFCKAMIKSNHTAMIEFGHAILKVDADTFEDIRYSNFKYLHMTEYEDNYLISGNIRAWRDFIQNSTCSNVLKEYILYIFVNDAEYKILFEDIKWNRNINISTVKHVVTFYNEIDLTIEEEKKHKYFHFVIETDRGVMAELTRHRNSSFAIQSTRYVNFKKGADFVIPHWYNKKVEGIWNKIKHALGKSHWRMSCYQSERHYKRLIQLGYKPQDARAVLPNSLKTLINISGNLENFEWIFRLRSAKSAHPDIRIISNEMKKIIDYDD